MSACISRHGEFSEHTLDELHTCTRCHVLDEDALRAELEQARSALAAVEQDRDRLRPLIGRLADQLEDLSKAQCWQGPRAFPGCDNGGCTHRRNLIAESRAAIAEHSGTEADSPHASK